MSQRLKIECFMNTMRNSNLHRSFVVDKCDCHSGFFFLSPTACDVIIDLPLVCAYTGRRRCNTDQKRPAQITSGEVMSCHVHVPVPNVVWEVT